MSVTFDNTAFSGGQSELGLYAAQSFTGTGALSGTAPVTINGTIDQPGSEVSININTANITAVGATGTYLGFSPADENGNNIYYFTVNGAGLNTPVTVGVSTGAAVPLAGIITPVNTANVTAPICYATGTRIRTSEGEVRVEALKVGDEVVTASGKRRPIVWIGHRDMSFTDMRNPRDFLPVRILADAIADGVPARDLVVSPGHRVLLDGVLVQAGMLVNDMTIVREHVSHVTYWHVELESHDILLAEGMPAESYAEAANRTAFDNGEVVFGGRPTTSIAISVPLCAPLIDSGPRLETIRDSLAERARSVAAAVALELGVDEWNDPTLQLVADGIPLTPGRVEDQLYSYNVPAGVSRLVLRSATAVPRDTQAGSADARRLGVCVMELLLDGASVPVDDSRLGLGWNEPENGGEFRWTSGEAELPLARSVAFRAKPLPVYTIAEPHKSETLTLVAGQRQG